MTDESFQTAADTVLATHQAVTTRHGGRVPAPPRTLRELRLAAGISLRELAETSGLQKGTLSQIERGRIVATKTEADQLATALGLDPGALENATLLIHRGRAA
jgi:DNA-binding XRE family transcriptional regulator